MVKKKQITRTVFSIKIWIILLFNYSVWLLHCMCFFYFICKRFNFIHQHWTISPSFGLVPGLFNLCYVIHKNTVIIVYTRLKDSAIIMTWKSDVWLKRNRKKKKKVKWLTKYDKSTVQMNAKNTRNIKCLCNHLREIKISTIISNH